MMPRQKRVTSRRVHSATRFAVLDCSAAPSSSGGRVACSMERRIDAVAASLAMARRREPLRVGPCAVVACERDDAVGSRLPETVCAGLIRLPDMPCEAGLLRDTLGRSAIPPAAPSLGRGGGGKGQPLLPSRASQNHWIQPEP